MIKQTTAPYCKFCKLSATLLTSMQIKIHVDFGKGKVMRGKRMWKTFIFMQSLPLKYKQ